MSILRLFRRRPAPDPTAAELAAIRAELAELRAEVETLKPLAAEAEALRAGLIGRIIATYAWLHADPFGSITHAKIMQQATPGDLLALLAGYENMVGRIIKKN